MTYAEIAEKLRERGIGQCKYDYFTPSHDTYGPHILHVTHVCLLGAVQYAWQREWITTEDMRVMVLRMRDISAANGWGSVGEANDVHDVTLEHMATLLGDGPSGTHTQGGHDVERPSSGADPAT